MTTDAFDPTDEVAARAGADVRRALARPAPALAPIVMRARQRRRRKTVLTISAGLGAALLAASAAAAVVAAARGERRGGGEDDRSQSDRPPGVELHLGSAFRFSWTPADAAFGVGLDS